MLCYSTSFLRALWTGGIEHVDEIATWEVAFELIKLCRRCVLPSLRSMLCLLTKRSVPACHRASRMHIFMRGNDWNALLLGAIAENSPRSVPLYQILLESAPTKHEGYDSFLEKKFPCVNRYLPQPQSNHFLITANFRFPPDSKVNWPSTPKINNRGELIEDD